MDDRPLSYQEMYENEHENCQLLDIQNHRLIDAAKGRGMVSELENWEEVAVLVCGLHDRIRELEAENERLRTAAHELILAIAFDMRHQEDDDPKSEVAFDQLTNCIADMNRALEPNP